MIIEKHLPVRLVAMIFLLFAVCSCHTGRMPREDAASAAESPAYADSLFDLQRYRGLFVHKNDLRYLPGTLDTLDDSRSFAADSMAVRRAYQDSANHYYSSDVGSGNKFYGFIDTFRSFNVVSMYTGMGDGGDEYDILTFSKGGKRVSCLEAAILQGEESDWTYDQVAEIAGDTIRVRATNCHQAGSSAHCDTMDATYRFTAVGEIVLIKADSIMDPALNRFR